MKSEENIIDITGNSIPIEKNGLYDCFRSNPPLSVIAKEAPQIDLSWFKTIQKEKRMWGSKSIPP